MQTFQVFDHGWAVPAFSGTVLIPGQKSGPAPERSRTPEELESPPYSPTPSCTERPRISSPVLSELKLSCAVLVNDTNPPSDDYDQPPDHLEALRKYKEQQAAKKQAQIGAAEKLSKKDQETFTSRWSRKEAAETEPKPAPYKHVPKNAAADFENTAIPRRPSQSYRHEDFEFEPIEPYHTRTSTKSKDQPTSSDDPLFRIRAALESRPKTSAAACIDYSGPSVDTSNATSRSNTTYDGHGRPISTGVTSVNLTPGDEKRSSFNIQNQRVSEQILHDGASASLADATAKAWMMQELARRRAEYKAGPARPGSRSSHKPTSTAEDTRPPSRAGSIARSVTEGVREYIRPRASMDSMRSSRPETTDLSRSHSRSSSRNRSRDSNGGWRAQLRRRGSFSSWRSTKPQQEEENSPNPDGGVNLNRELPALPGLDQYKEKKPKPTHIAQIMRPGHRTAKTEKAKPVTMSTFNTSSSLPLSPTEEQRRQYEIRKAVDEKMRTSPRPATTQGPPLKHSATRSPQSNTYSPRMTSPQGHYNAGLKAPTFPETMRTQSQPVLPSVRVPAVTVQEIAKSPEQGKRRSLRKRLSRFWSSGVEKEGKMVAAN